MERISSLNELLMEELADLLSAENKLVEALPKMAQASQSLALKIALEAHLEVTKEQAGRLQDILSNIGQNSQRGDCKAVKRFINEGEYTVSSTENSPSRDTAIISTVQRVEQYEVDGYKTAREHAENLGHTRIVELVDKSLEEKRGMNLHLSELAQGSINAQAIGPKSSGQPGGFYVPKDKFGRKGVKKKPKNKDVSRFIDEGNPNFQDPKEPRDLP